MRLWMTLDNLIPPAGSIGALVPAPRLLCLPTPWLTLAHGPYRARASVDMMFLAAVIVYAVAGLTVSLAFVAFGVTRVLKQPAPVSIGARIVLLPGAVALWPYVLFRWLRAEGAR
jgi:hypothetical protein